MAQQTFSIRMDSELKDKFDALCEDMGMNATTAFNIFARTVVREQKIPFEIKAQNEEKKVQEKETQAKILALLNALNN